LKVLIVSLDYSLKMHVALGRRKEEDTKMN